MKENQINVCKFKTSAKKLKRPISASEVKGATDRMSNGRATGKDETYVEMIKYGPERLFKEVPRILNNIFEKNSGDPDTGVGILQPIPKPKKQQGPPKNLRPVTLLETIKKTLSKIFMNRAEK